MTRSLSIHQMLFVLSSLVLIVITAQYHVDDECLLSNGKQGKCQRIENCPSALEIIRNQGKPEHCGFEGTQPVVCCERQRKVGEISMKKCLEYSLKPPTLYISKTPQDPIVSDLTLGDIINVAEKSESRSKLSLSPIEVSSPPPEGAVGGIDALPFQFPHMAVLGYGEEDDINWLCGGSLISEKYVLTAAHCINPLSRGPVKYIRLGDLNLKLTTDDAKPQNFKVARSIIHPGYKSPSVYNDIALIELSSNSTFDTYVQPACLQTETDIPESFWSATGWGVTSFGGSPADHLQNVALRSYTLEECQTVYSTTPPRKLKNGIDFKTQVCAGELYKDTCQGDSGGPLQVWSDDKPGGYIKIIGVTSFGKACGIGDNPAVYTRVSHYIDWIESIIWP